jgi:hypothetical protein
MSVLVNKCQKLNLLKKSLKALFLLKIRSCNIKQNLFRKNHRFKNRFHPKNQKKKERENKGYKKRRIH